MSLITGHIADDAPVVGYTGPNGFGKTLIAVSDCIQDIKRGRRVVSSVPITCEWGQSEPLRSLAQFSELRECTVLLDEVAALLDSRDTGSLPAEVRVFLGSMRHSGVTLRWTAPAWSMADVRLRQVTQVLVNVQALGRRRVAGSFWPRPLLVLAGALDVASIPVDHVPDKVLRRRLWIPERLIGWGAYDTKADVRHLGHPGTGGYCVDCGGRLPIERCTPERHEELGLLPACEQPAPEATDTPDPLPHGEATATT